MVRLMGGALVVAVSAILAPAMVQAEVAVNARVEISAAVAGSSLTGEEIQRRADSRDRVRQQEIAVLQAQLVEARAQGATEVARLEAALVEAREALVADLARDSPAYAEAILVFRSEVTDIASTPEGVAALAQFNRGEEVEALEVLYRIIAAADRADQVAAEGVIRAVQAERDRAAAARRRPAIALALDARNRSRLGTEKVITLYEDVTRLDPGEYDDWYQLVQLYIAAGRRADALTAAERLEALAEGPGRGAVAVSARP